MGYTIHSNHGRCKRCELSEMKDIHGDGKQHRWCIRYDNICQSVARNCNAPSRGFRVVQKTENGIEVE